jgi:hypothetical protein
MNDLVAVINYIHNIFSNVNLTKVTNSLIVEPIHYVFKQSERHKTSFRYLEQEEADFSASQFTPCYR